MGDVLFTDDMAALESCALEAILHFGDIVAQLHADGIFNIDLFHGDFLSLFNPAGEEWILWGCEW